MKALLALCCRVRPMCAHPYSGWFRLVCLNGAKFRMEDDIVRFLSVICMAVVLSSCGVAYQSPGVEAGLSDDAKVRVVTITPQTALVANRSEYRPQTLPAIFSQTAGGGSA
jgi:hypothetical protein